MTFIDLASLGCGSYEVFDKLPKSVPLCVVSQVTHSLYRRRMHARDCTFLVTEQLLWPDLPSALYII